MSCGDPPQCTCTRYGDLTYTPMSSYCPVHYPNITCCAGAIPNQTFTIIAGSGTAWSPLSATKVEVEAPAGKPIVVVTIDGIRFVTDCADSAQAMALAERVARALGIQWSPL